MNRSLSNMLYTLLVLFGPGLLSSTTSLGATVKQPTKPNIIFIMADDLGYAHLGCYGQKKILTPCIDKMASEGMRFTQHYAGAPVCAPARSVLMTGMHGGHTSVRGNSGGIPLLDKDITVGEVLKTVNYRTGIFGKWGLGRAGSAGVPNKQGFDEFFGYLHQVHCHFYYPYYLWHNQEKYLLPGNEGGKRLQYTHDEIMAKALDFIKTRDQRPFFLYLPFTIPHTELLVPDDSFRQYAGKFPEPHPYKNRKPHYANQPAPRTAFAAMVSRMDRDVGRLMDLLKEQGIDKQTIVFFTSDNGGQDGGGPDIEFFRGNGPLRAAKGWVYEGGIRVPMIVRWPGKVTAASTSDHVWAFYDVMPTLAELAGAKAPDSIDGLSALPSILGADQAGHKQQKHRFLYWEMPRGKGLSQAVRMGDWKAVRTTSRQPLELYNLKSDIGEQHNVASEHPDIVATIENYLKSARVPTRKYKKEPPTWGYPREKTGYLR